MEEEPVNTVREGHRKLLQLNRKLLRDEESDVRRCLDNLSITPNVVMDIAIKLKTKASISESELNTVKNGLIQDPKNIGRVLNTHGAVRGLVRELTGHDIKKQCAAAGCLCNLAQGDSKAGVAVAKAAGPYLIAAMDSLVEELAVCCAWALGNVAGSGPRACALLAALAAPAALAARLPAPGPAPAPAPRAGPAPSPAPSALPDAALYALLHYALHAGDQLSMEHLKKIQETVTKMKTSKTSSHLLFVLSCHKDFLLPTTLLAVLLQELTVSINKHILECKEIKDCCQCLYLVRTFANVTLNDEVYSVTMDYLLNNDLVTKIESVLRKEDQVSESMLWFLGNLYNHCSDNEFFNKLIN